MRVNRITATAVTVSLAGSLALGAAGIAAADHAPAPAAPVPAPKAGELSQQAEALKDSAVVSDAIGSLLSEVAASQQGRITQVQADKHAKRIEKAIAALKSTKAPKAPQSDGSRKAPSAELKDRAAAALQTKANALLKASTAGDARKTEAAARETLLSAVNVIAASGAHGKLPAADLKGLGKAPARPQQPKQQQTPQNQQNPQAPQNQQAPQNPQAPQNQQNPQAPQNPQASQAPQNPQSPQAQQAPQNQQVPSTQQDVVKPAAPAAPAQNN